MKRKISVVTMFLLISFWYESGSAFFPNIAFWKKITVASPILDFIPANYDFGRTAVTTAYQVKNIGTGTSSTLTLSISGSSRFTISSDTCTGATLAVNATCSFTANFNNGGGPPNDGCYNATLTVTDGNSTDTSALSGEARDSNGLSDCGGSW